MIATKSRNGKTLSRDGCNMRYYQNPTDSYIVIVVMSSVSKKKV